MDAQTLFREGVLALRDRKDVAEARRLLTQSLKLDPNNEMAWLWLSRTTDDPQRKLQCVERALRLNPNNQQAIALRDRLRSSSTPAPSVASAPPAPTPSPQRPAASTPAFSAAPDVPYSDLRATVDSSHLSITGNYVASDADVIKAVLAEADRLMALEDTEGAIAQWVRVLQLEPDHPVAIQSAVRHLYALGYRDDASELIDRAIDAGSQSLPIHLTGIDLARVRGMTDKADNLREKAAALPDADEDLILKTANHFVNNSQHLLGVEILKRGLERFPASQPMLLRMAALQDETMGDKTEARRFYEMAAKGKKGHATKAAEKALNNYVPTVTDRERGSFLLAFREAVGFGIIFVLLGWQDAGLDLFQLGPQRWLGVGLSILGGYLMVTGLSAPQQKPLAAWLGGKVPPQPRQPAADPLDEGRNSSPQIVEEPTALPIIPGVFRVVFALVGLIVLAGAFMLVFSTAISLLRNPVPPTIPSIQDLLAE